MVAVDVVDVGDELLVDAVELVGKKVNDVVGIVGEFVVKKLVGRMV